MIFNPRGERLSSHLLLAEGGEYFAPPPSPRLTSKLMKGSFETAMESPQRGASNAALVLCFKPRPAWGWGRADSASPTRFSRYIKNGRIYRSETSSIFSGINFASSIKISEKYVEKFLRKLRLSDVMFRRFG